MNLFRSSSPSQLMAANELLDASVTDVTATPVEHDTYAMMWNANLGVETPDTGGCRDL